MFPNVAGLLGTAPEDEDALFDRLRARP